MSNENNVPSTESLQATSSLLNVSTSKVVGSMSLPIYIYDCNILGLTNNLIYKEGYEKPKNHHLNFLFKPERTDNDGGEERSSNQKTPEPELCDMVGHIDREVKQWYQIIKMIYFKSFVSVLFRSLQLKYSVHSYDIQQAIAYSDNDSSCDLELEAFVKAVCPHLSARPTELDSKIDIESLKSGTSCFALESWHRSVQKKFLEIVGSKFRVVPGMEDVFFFCPPGLELGDVLRVGSRRRNETKSSESTSRHLNSDRQRPEEEDDKTIEFRSNASHQSLKLNRVESIRRLKLRPDRETFKAASPLCPTLNKNGSRTTKT